MPVFKTYLKIVRSKLGLLIMYLVIFLSLSIAIARAGEQSNPADFQEASLNIGVVDRDNSDLSKELADYLALRHEVQPIADSKETMQDELYYNNLAYILIIPEGFTASFEQSASENSADAAVELENIKSPQSNSGYLVDTQLNEFLTNVRAYLMTGETVADAAKSAAELQNIETETAFYSDTNTHAAMPTSYYYMHYIPYIMTTLLILAFSPALLALFRAEVRRRSYCSSTSLRDFNRQVLLGCLFITVVILALVAVLWFCLYGKQLFDLPLLYIFCNLLSFTIVCMGLGFLTAFLVNNENAVNMFVNLFSLGFSFLGGVFIPQELLSPKILPVSRLLPSYWYAKSNQLIFQNPILDSSQIMEILRNCGLQLAFAFAVFTVALLLSRRKMTAQ